jgi:hypothetical protein
MKRDESCPFGVDQTVAIGISQTGRFLRQYLFQGFNTDESGQMSLDGLMIHTAGAGRGSFNHRFAQPSRDGHRYSTFFFPTDLFPFTGRTQMDRLTDNIDGLLDHHRNDDHIPKIFYTNTGYEYWGRAAALLHIDPGGYRDVEPMPTERIYHLASGQHFVVPFPPRQDDGESVVRGDPLDFLVNLRALLVRMLAWIEDGVAPPDSAYPRLARGELATVGEVRYPAIPGLERPRAAHEAYRADYGASWRRGIITNQPPELGDAFPALVPQVDRIGNELGGIRNLEIRVPLATYLPWRVRGDGLANPDELSDFYGSFAPLPLTRAQRRDTRDSRPSIERLYRSKQHYLDRCAAEAEKLVAEGFLLEEDIDRVLTRAEAIWDWTHAR